MAIKKNVNRQVIGFEEHESEVEFQNIHQRSSNSNVNLNQNVESMDFDMEYSVQGGETLSEIASKYGLTYQELADYNNIADPNYIEVGQTIKIPNGVSEPSKEPNITPNNDSNTYSVKAGDNLGSIAKKYGVSVEDLVDLNKIKDPNYIEVGQTIKIPGKEETNPQPAANNNQELADLIKTLSKKVNDTFETIGPALNEKLSEVNQNNEEAVKNVVETLKSSFKNSDVKIDPEKIGSLIKNLTKSNSDEQMTNFGKQMAASFANFDNNIPLIIEILKSFITKNATNKTSKTEDQTYSVQSGDSLSKIAAKYGVSVEEIVKANNISDPNNINVGEQLKIPSVSQEKKVNKENKNVTKKIDLSKILKNSKIGDAVIKYAEEINDAFKVKINENEFITIKETEVNGNKCYVTHVVIDDPSTISGEPANGGYAQGLEKSSSAAKRKNASLLINGSHFLSNGAQDLNSTNHLAIVNGKIVKDGSSLGMEICLDKNGKLFTPAPGTTAQQLLDKGVVYTFSSHDSLLLQNGQKYPDQEGKVYNSTVIGMTEPGEYYILTGATSNAGARDYLYDKGCTYAKSMDQGGSVTLVFEDEVINHPTDSTGERSVGDFLYFT